METLCFCQKLSMDKNQTIEMWSSLSPRPTRGIVDEELLRDEHADEEKSDRDREYRRVDPVETHSGEGDA
jgi:hypothetical protein